MVSPIQILTILLFSITSLASAQVELPQKSPPASITQRVGLTDITIAYSSPAVRSRVIWGELVPYGKVWRSGANQATTITFSKDVRFEDKIVSAGTYSLYTIPEKESWTIILNKRYGVGGLDYDEKSDILQVKVKPEDAPMRERLRYDVANFTDSSAEIRLEWEKLSVPVHITVDTKTQADANIASAIEKAWKLYADSARYELESKGDLTRALAWINQSMAMKDDWYNNWIKSQIVAAQGKYKDAITLAEHADELGKDAKNYFAAEMIKNSLSEWQSKLN